ncbi:MAG: DegT/DnrJ/EryC1/StrS family aminotransferase [Hyphomicrobiaceae bacterium]
MQWKYVLSEPDLGRDEIEAATACIASGWLSMGPRTRAFETTFAAMHGVKHAFAVANGTAALHIALAALEVGRSEADEVIQPSMSFVAAANMTVTVGAKPVFADIIALDEPTIDPADIARRITPHTRAIVVMHYGGYACRMAEIMALADRHGIPVIEDACHAPGQPYATGRSDCGFEGRHLGTIGAIGCFSFFSNKNMTCGEGGMVVTNDDNLADRIKSLRSHGMTTLSWDRHQGRATTYDVTLNGFNYRLDDLRAALASVQLAKLPTANARRRVLAKRYAAAFRAFGDPEVRYVFADRAEDGTAHVGAVLVPEADRDRVRAVLAERGIQTSLHYPPIHLFTAFADSAGRGLARTEELARRVITLPLYPGLEVEAVDEITATIAAILRANAKAA